MFSCCPFFQDKPSQTTVLQHDVDVGNHKPIKQHAYRVNPTQRAAMQKEAEYHLENGLAVPSSSPWSSPCLLIPKSDKTPRFCADFRKVNSVTKPDCFPLPHMDDCVDRVGSAKFFLQNSTFYKRVLAGSFNTTCVRSLCLHHTRPFPPLHRNALWSEICPGHVSEVDEHRPWWG